MLSGALSSPRGKSVCLRFGWGTAVQRGQVDRSSLCDWKEAEPRIQPKPSWLRRLVFRWDAQRHDAHAGFGNHGGMCALRVPEQLWLLVTLSLANCTLESQRARRSTLAQLPMTGAPRKVVQTQTVPDAATHAAAFRCCWAVSYSVFMEPQCEGSWRPPGGMRPRNRKDFP